MSVEKIFLEGYDKVSSGNKYIGQCNHIRCTMDNGRLGATDTQGEEWWNVVMDNKKPITPGEIVAHVGEESLADGLGEESDELEAYFIDAQRGDPDFGVYVSTDPEGDTIYLIQNAGFEFFWRGK